MRIVQPSCTLTSSHLSNVNILSSLCRWCRWMWGLLRICRLDSLTRFAAEPHPEQPAVVTAGEVRGCSARRSGSRDSGSRGIAAFEQDALLTRCCCWDSWGGLALLVSIFVASLVINSPATHATFAQVSGGAILAGVALLTPQLVESAARAPRLFQPAGALMAAALLYRQVQLQAPHHSQSPVRRGWRTAHKERCRRCAGAAFPMMGIRVKPANVRLCIWACQHLPAPGNGC